MPRRELKPTDVRIDLDAVEFPSERYARLNEEREESFELRPGEEVCPKCWIMKPCGCDE